MITQITEKKEITPANGKIYLEIDNGDLQALEAIKAAYPFTDFQSLLRFALVILLRAEDNTIYINENGKRLKITPTEEVPETNETSEH